MRNIYNKGRFRLGEWAKHLRPDGKQWGNRKFRKNVNEAIEEELTDVFSPFRKFSPKKKPIVIKITIGYFGGFKHSYIGKYSTVRDAKNALGRSNVLRYFIIQGEEFFR